MTIGSIELQVDYLFAYKWGTYCCGTEKPFQLDIHTLLNDIHASGDKTEEIIGKYLSFVYDRTYRAKIMQTTFVSINLLMVVPILNTQWTSATYFTVMLASI